MSRYVERTENIARLINVNNSLLLDLPKKAALGSTPLINITGCAPLFHKLYDEVTERNVVKFLIADSNSPGLSKNRRYDYLRSIILGTEPIADLLAGTMAHDDARSYRARDTTSGQKQRKITNAIRVTKDAKSCSFMGDRSLMGLSTPTSRGSSYPTAARLSTHRQ